MIAQIKRNDLRVFYLFDDDKKSLPLSEQEAITLHLEDDCGVELGMKYNEGTGEFYEADPDFPEPLPKPPPTTEEYLVDLDYRLSLLELGL